MKTTDVDVRQIRVFLAVAQSGGFSASQDVLNLAQSTISTEIAALEGRLGYTLCKRGRGGFKLTPQGEAFVNDATALLSALSLFEISVAKHKKQGLGDVRIAIIDNLVTDPKCPLIGAFDRFHRRTGGRAHIYLDVLSPREIEQGVSSGKIDAAIGIFTETLPHLRYVPLYKERDVLVCGNRHPLFEEKSDVRLFSKIRNDITASPRTSTASRLQRSSYWRAATSVSCRTITHCAGSTAERCAYWSKKAIRDSRRSPWFTTRIRRGSDRQHESWFRNWPTTHRILR